MRTTIDENGTYNVVGTNQRISFRAIHPFYHAAISRNRGANMPPQNRVSFRLVGAVDFHDTNNLVETIRIVVEEFEKTPELATPSAIDILKSRIQKMENVLAYVNHTICVGLNNPILSRSLDADFSLDEQPLDRIYCKQRLFNSTLALSITLLTMGIVISELIVWGVKFSASDELIKLKETALDLSNIVTQMVADLVEVDPETTPDTYFVF